MIPDIHAREEDFPLNGNGFVTFKVFVTKKIATVNLGSSPVYSIKTAMKVSIYNNEAFSISPGAVTIYQNYPALFYFTKSLTSLATPAAATLKLLNYSPKTVNSSITSSRSDNAGKSSTNSVQQSVGSADSQTNSFGINLQGGEMMGMPMFTAGLSYDYAYTASHSRERSTAAGNNTDTQIGDSESFSIKDWGVYAKVNRDTLETSWVCAQEYPWDVLRYRSLDGQNNIELPDSIAARLLDGDCVLPPSQLSQFGTDFTFTAEWTLTPAEENFDVTADVISIPVAVSYVLGTHQRTGNASPFKVAATLGQPTSATNTVTLTWGDLEWLSLEPLTPGRNDASINFEKLPAARFPASRTAPLTINSPTNSLFCMTSGFGVGMVVDTAKAPASYTLKFKVTDTVGDLTLYLKHWKLDAPGLLVNVTINDAKLPVQYVDAMQGEGGAGNRTAITLRSTDYMHEDFVDYLVVGLNTVTVSVAANGVAPAPSARYCLSSAVVS